MKNLRLQIPVILLLISMNAFCQDGKFSFTLGTAARTSAGVFKDDSILVKTLWSDERYNAGTYTKYWDGTDDYGNKINSPASTYKIKVLSNNVQYTWEGTIGNTSDNMTGLSKMKGLYDCMKGLTFAGDYGYYCTGYGEGAPSVYKFNIGSPNQKMLIFPATLSTNQVDYVTTDGTTVYWGCYDAFDAHHTWVFGTNTNDDTETEFSNGTSFTPTHTKNYPSAISYMNSDNGIISGLAVQKRGRFLFVARAGLNQLQVLDKTSGQVIQTLNYTRARGLCVDGDDRLWMISDANQVAKYSVNDNGTLTSATLTLSGLLDPLATQVSPDGNTISIADGKTSQQVKSFSNSSGSLIHTQGDAGGYFSDATVSDNKFYFNDARGSKSAFIAFEPNGSFWVNDPGNYRVQHYNSNRSIVNRIMSLGSTYSSGVDRNNISRVFASFLEFNVDYSVPLTGSTGWSLTKNWGANVTDAYDDDIFFIKHQVTLSNGRTYAFMKKANDNELVELPSSGPLRFTGLLFNAATVLCSDGSLQVYEEANGTFACKRYPLTGFDGLNNPTWGSSGELIVSGTKKEDTPITYPTLQMFSSNNKAVFFNTHSMTSFSPEAFTKGYHMAVLSQGKHDVFLAQTEKSTHRSYSGAYPGPGWFDIGNTVNDYAGGAVNIVDRNIITSYHGEFWKASQANMFNYYYDNGLAIGQFGTTGDQTRSGYADSMIAGNVLSPYLVKSPDGNLYMWHGDESAHAGVHRWKISNLSSIAEQEVTMNYPSNYAIPAVDYVDLMAGLPQRTVLPGNVAGWTRDPAWDFGSPERATDGWLVSTSKYSYKQENDNDIFIQFLNKTSKTSTVSRDLGNNYVTSKWKVTGFVSYTHNSSNADPVHQYFEVLDEAGNVLTTLYPTIDRSKHPIYTSRVNGNGATLFSVTELYTPTFDNTAHKLQPFSIKVEQGQVTFEYAGFPPVTTNISDAKGDWHKPKTLRARFTHNGENSQTPYTANIVISNLKFYKDYSEEEAKTGNQAPVANAGQDITIAFPLVTASLNGSGTDADGSITNYSWTKIAGPGNGWLATPGNATTLVNNMEQGTYQFELTVTDNNGAIAKDVVQVVVGPAPAISLLPAVDPANTVNGLDYKYYEGSWSVLPDFASLNPVTTGNTDGFKLSVARRSENYGISFTGFITVPADGQYKFYTTSDDGSSLYIDNVLVVSNDGLHGAEERSGSIGLKAGKHAITGLVFQQGGGQVFEVGYEGMGVSKQSVTAAALYRIENNLAPEASAGSNQVIALPTNTVVLNGSGNDADGSISSYKWAQVDGPSTGSIVSSNTASTTISNLVEGDYQFELTVTDDHGAIGKSGVEVVVVAAAGGSLDFLLPAVNPANVVNGLNYQYYEGNWNILPEFAALAPVKTGTTQTFDISLRNRADQYGFNFSGYIEIPADGQYTFYTTSDDGSSLYIDNILVVDNDGLHSSLERSGVIGLKAGKHAISGLFFQQGGGEVFEVRYEGMGIQKQAIPEAKLFRDAGDGLKLFPDLTIDNLVNGLDYKYYEGNWSELPDFTALTPVETGSTPYFNLGLANRLNQFGFSFTGYIQIPADGEYHFYTTSDDGSNLYIDNMLVVANDGLHSAVEKSGSIGLKAGKHAIRGLFFQQTGDKIFEVSYEGAGTSKQQVPLKSLYRVSNGSDAVKTKAAIPGQLTTPVAVVAADVFGSENTVKVYPNPVRDVANLNITTVRTNKKVSISVHNSVGGLVRMKQLSGAQLNAHHQLDMSRLSPGLYIITVKFDNGETISYKLIRAVN